MSGRGVFRLALFVFVLFFLVMIAAILGSSGLPSAQLAHLEAPFAKSLRQGPIAPLLASPQTMVRALGIFLTNLRFLAVALAGALLFRWRVGLGRLLGTLAVLYFVLGLFSNAVLGGVVVESSSRLDGTGWPQVMALGILPHGVFEIASYALGFGVLMASRTGRGLRGRPLVWGLLPVAVLVVAALIEATVTPHLLLLLKR